MRSIAIFACLALGSALTAADDEWGVRLCGQLMVGTSDFEPGGAVEIPLGQDRPLLLRPELFVNSDATIGGGVSVLWRLPLDFIPDDHAVWAGPRGVLHNQDENDSNNNGDASGWEIDFMALYNIPIPNHDRHNVEIIGAVGFLQEKHPVEDDDLVFGASIGAAYAYRF
jgi:hypothetical protein